MFTSTSTYVRNSIVRVTVVVFYFSFISFVGAAALPWDFNPPTAGAALLEGGWMVKRQITTINPSPEFTFPLQLVYFSNRTGRGDFGDQWFCPQLESRVLPGAQGVLVWTMPNGGVVGLFKGRKQTQFFDPKGQWEANLTGTAVAITNAEGWAYSYRAGRLTSLTAPSGRKLEYGYKATHLNTIELTDPATGTVKPLLTITRQADDRLTAMEAVDGKHVFAYEDGRGGKLLSWKHPGPGKPDLFEYDKDAGFLTSIQPSAASSERLVFQAKFVSPLDAAGKPVREPNAEKNLANYPLLSDNTYRYSYSGKPGVITLLDKAGGKQTLEYNPNRGVQVSVDAAGIETKTYFYRAPGKRHDGKLRRVERAGQIMADYYYDVATGNLIESRDATGLSTFYEYNAKAEPLLIDKPIAIRGGTKKSKKLLAELKYDKKGRIVEKTEHIDEAPAQITRYTYSSRGQLESVTDPLGKKSLINYDKYGRTTSVTEGEQRQDLDYDDQGRIKIRKTPDGQTIETLYDERGAVSEIKQNGIVVNSFERDLNGRFLIQRDALGRPTWMEYDNRGRVLAEHQPNGTTTWYGYDAAGRRTSQIDGQGNRIEFVYDTAGRLVRQTNPLQQALTWEYDTLGRLNRRTNGVQTITYSYDDDSRLTLLDYGRPGEKLRYRYDERGRVRKITTPTNSLALFYDDQNQVLAKQFIRGITTEQPTSARVVRYSYNPQGQKTGTVLSEKTPPSVTPDPSSKAAAPDYRLLQQTQYQYDTAGRLGAIRSNGTAVSTFRYDAKGRLAERTYGNGIVGRYAYDTFGRQARLDLSGGPLHEPLLLAYEWDTAGQLLSRTWNGEKQIYGYDLSGQLLSVVAAATSQTTAAANGANKSAAHSSTPGSTGGSPVESGGSPDPSSSRAAKAPSPILVSNPTPPTPATLLEQYRYDAAGNLLEKYEHGLKTSLIYDAANQLSTTLVPGRAGILPAAPGVSPGASSAETPVVTNYTYDRAGRLLSEDGPNSKTRTYGFLDKVLVLQKSDGTRLGYDYYPDGQLAAKGPLSQLPAQQTDENGHAVSSDSALNPNVSKGVALLKELVGIKADDDRDLTPSKEQAALSVSEELIWDGLALLYRNGETFAVEPHISGGIPVASTSDPKSASHTYYLNDILGTTLAVVRPDKIEVVPLTAFGKPRSATPPTTNSAPPTEPTLSPENDSPAKTQKTSK